MAKGKLFERAVLYHPRPTKEQRDAGETPKSVVVMKPDYILASSDQEVSIQTARALPEEYLAKLEDVEILVRPF
jgi:hypothetical protein